ncbi:outer membrane beta-barrel protein [Croceicoccus hydrothermalis]|uniref:outer membrane beta-barrel protein n=1 Tax=Croceicoccus hydrothermalis TaxID=2867964 RepID=UPI001EFB77B4|nr:outer membrane beta-barrel protein [Croceicoccus hydrothermalis]
MKTHGSLHSETKKWSSSLSRIRGFFLLLLSGAFGTLPASQQAWSQSREISLKVLTVYDDNLFQLTDDQKDAVDPSDEFSTFVGANLEYNTRISLFDITVNGDIGGRFYANNSQFNSEEYRLAGRTQYLAESGSAQFDAMLSRQNLSFSDPLFRGTNIRSLERFSVRGDRRILSDFHVAGSARVSSSSSPGSDLRGVNNTIYAYSAGIEYVSPIKNRIGVGYSQSRSEGDGLRTVLIGGDPILYSPEASSEGVYAEIIWTAPVTYSLSGRVGYTWHDDRSPRDIDYQGLTYNVAASWAPLRSLNIAARAVRSFSSNDELFSNGVVLNSYSLGVSGTAYGRLGFNAGIERAEREFRFLPRNGLEDSMNRTDKFWVLQAGLNYELGSGINAALSASRVLIDDSTIADDITSNAITLTLLKSFQF